MLYIYMKPKLDDTQGRSRTLKIIQEIDQTLKDTSGHSLHSKRPDTQKHSRLSKKSKHSRLSKI